MHIWPNELQLKRVKFSGVRHHVSYMTCHSKQWQRLPSRVANILLIIGYDKISQIYYLFLL